MADDVTGGTVARGTHSELIYYLVLIYTVFFVCPYAPLKGLNFFVKGSNRLLTILIGLEEVFMT